MIHIVRDDTPPGVPVFITRMSVRWGDMDAEGHVNNSGFFRFMEETRMRWISAMGMPTTPPHPVIVLLNAACHYTRSLEYPATVEVALAAGRVGRTSVQTHYTLRQVEADAVCAEGYATLVWYDMQGRKAVPLPQQILAACKAPA
jgi:acyl-CoA thioester hydrolase